MDGKLAYDLYCDFLNEAQEILNIPKEDWLRCVMGVVMVEGKAIPIQTMYDQKKVYFFPQIIEMMSYGQDVPTVIRLYAYGNANLWKRSLQIGRHAEEIPDDIITAMAISTIKGLQMCDHPLFAQHSAEIIDKIKELFGLNVSIQTGVPAMGKDKGVPRKVVRVNNDEEYANYLNNIASLMQAESVANKPLNDIKDGDYGSESNPFENIDEAAEYVKGLEKVRLGNDSFRRFISNTPYFINEQRLFAIPWASPYASLINCPNRIEDGFVVNQLVSRRFCLKPTLVNHKFLFRGQAEFHSPCVPNMFRKHDETYFLKYNIFSNEMSILLKSHPLIQFFEKGFEAFNDFFRLEINYGGLSQHYYNKTQFLDLTSNIEAAKFFAVTDFDFDNNKYVPYLKDGKGVLYYYDIEPGAFTKGYYPNYQLSSIGKQPFMRSGAQHGFLLAMPRGLDFNNLPQVRCVYFKHNKDITNRIYKDSLEGKKYMSDDILQHHWYEKINDPVRKNEVSQDALNLNHKFNPKTSKRKLLQRLKDAGITVNRNYIPEFSQKELDEYYYSSIQNYWEDFCKDIYFHSPEGRVLKGHLFKLPQDPRYRQYFFNN